MARKRVKKSACARLIRFLKEHRNKRSKIMSDKRWREYDRDSKKCLLNLIGVFVRPNVKTGN